MVLRIRPFKCPFMIIVKQGHKHQFPNLGRMCCWDRDRSRIKSVFSWYSDIKSPDFISECLEDMRLMKNGSKMYLCDDEAKELVIICGHVHFFRKNEMNHQWDISLSPINHLWFGLLFAWTVPLSCLHHHSLTPSVCMCLTSRLPWWRPVFSVRQ